MLLLLLMLPLLLLLLLMLLLLLLMLLMLLMLMLMLMLQVVLGSEERRACVRVCLTLGWGGVRFIITSCLRLPLSGLALARLSESPQPQPALLHGA